MTESDNLMKKATAFLVAGVVFMLVTSSALAMFLYSKMGIP